MVIRSARRTAVGRPTPWAHVLLSAVILMAAGASAGAAEPDHYAPLPFKSRDGWTWDHKTGLWVNPVPTWDSGRKQWEYRTRIPSSTVCCISQKWWGPGDAVNYDEAIPDPAPVTRRKQAQKSQVPPPKPAGKTLEDFKQTAYFRSLSPEIQEELLARLNGSMARKPSRAAAAEEAWSPPAVYLPPPPPVAQPAQPVQPVQAPQPACIEDPTTREATTIVFEGETLVWNPENVGGNQCKVQATGQACSSLQFTEAFFRAGKPKDPLCPAGTKRNPAYGQTAAPGNGPANIKIDPTFLRVGKGNFVRPDGLPKTLPQTVTRTVPVVTTAAPSTPAPLAEEDYVPTPSQPSFPSVSAQDVVQGLTTVLGIAAIGLGAYNASHGVGRTYAPQVSRPAPTYGNGTPAAVRTRNNSTISGTIR